MAKGRLKKEFKNLTISIYLDTEVAELLARAKQIRKMPLDTQFELAISELREDAAEDIENLLESMFDETVKMIQQDPALAGIDAVN